MNAPRSTEKDQKEDPMIETEMTDRLGDIETTLIHERLSVDCADECSDDCGACMALDLISELLAAPEEQQVETHALINAPHRAECTCGWRPPLGARVMRGERVMLAFQKHLREEQGHG